LAGFTSLIANYLKREHGFGDMRTATGPSPALIKAYLTHSNRILSGGVGTSGLIMPSNNQGWGFPNGNDAFNNTVTRFIRDQQTVIGESGDGPIYVGTITDSTKPVRVAIAWTDPAGATSGNSWVNDLDLTVTVGTNTYKGNSLTVEGVSIANGGTADTKNNVEVVMIPVGASGEITISINGITIVGDGVPGNGDNTDQDFAVVASNVTYSPSPAFNGGAIIISDVGGNGNSNGAADPGEASLLLTIPISNVGEANATGVATSLLSGDANVTVVSANATYDTINIGSTGLNSQTFVVSVSDGAVCGAFAPLLLLTSSNGGISRDIMLELPIGRFVGGASSTVVATGLPLSIPDGVTSAPGVLNHTVSVSGLTGTISNVRLSGLGITHTWVSDLSLLLIAPGGASVLLSDRLGRQGDNYTGTTFDDGAAISITGGTVPFTGTFRPVAPLSTFDGLSPNGTWTLRASDFGAADVGTLLSWTLNVETEILICNPPSASTDDSFEPNNSLVAVRAATPLAVNSLNSNLVLANPDWYRISLPECENAKFTISFDNSRGNINAQLWEATCSDLGGLYRIAEAYSPTLDSETFTYVNKGAANVFLEVYGEGGAINPNYSVLIESTGTDDPYEPNSFPGIPFVLPPNIQYTDLVSKDDDFFRFPVPSGATTMDLNISANFNRGQLYWQVLEDNGTYNVINGGSSAFYVPNEPVMERKGMSLAGRSAIVVRVYGATGGSNFYNMKVDMM